MNWIDLVILIVVLLAAAVGALRGLIREVSSLVSVVLAFILAGWLYPQGLEMVSAVAANNKIPTPAGFAIVFAIFYLSLLLLGFLVRRILVRPLHLAWLDRLGGLVFGLAKGLALVLSLLLLCIATGAHQPVGESVLLPFAIFGAKTLVTILPEDLRKQLTENLERLERIQKPNPKRQVNAFVPGTDAGLSGGGFEGSIREGAGPSA